MKADVLNNFTTLKVAVQYKYNGHLSEEIPFESVTLDMEPVYEQLNGWNRKLKVTEDYNDLPDELKNYVRFIEQSVGVPVKIVSIITLRQDLPEQILKPRQRRLLTWVELKCRAKDW